MNLRRILGSFFIAVALLATSGCSHPQAQSSLSSRLLGTWFESRTGEEYKFLPGSLLVVPHQQAGGGNAVTYRVLDGGQLDIETSGSHHVSVIESITADRLKLTDPLGGTTQYFYRDVSRTKYVKSLEASALAAVSEFATISPDPTIVWVAKKPDGKSNEWVDWSPNTLTTYGTAWDWTTLKRDASPTLVSGAGSTAGYSFGFKRNVPTAKMLEAFTTDTSLEATAGLAHIDVGYAAGKAKYPAGTLVYLPRGLIYSLGDGYAIAVGIDRKTQSFVPITHK